MVTAGHWESKYGKRRKMKKQNHKAVPQAKMIFAPIAIYPLAHFFSKINTFKG